MVKWSNKTNEILVIEKSESLGELEKLWKHLPAALVPTEFLVLPNFHSCFYNSIETRYMFSISQTSKSYTDTETSLSG